jgi:hypothetical protein
LLAIFSAAVVVVVGLEVTWRLRNRSPAGLAASRLERLLLLVVALTAAGGLGLLAGGARPRELLHFVYSAAAIGALPASSSFSAGWEPRRRGIVTILGLLITLISIQRLFATG